MQALEGKDGVLSISLGHGFGMGDVADCGAKLWVITDDDPAKASSLAQQLGREFWDLRNAVPTYSFDWREALTTAWTSAQRPVVLADTRSEEHTSELQSLMRISYAVFCLKKKKK